MQFQNFILFKLSFKPNQTNQSKKVILYIYIRAYFKDFPILNYFINTKSKYEIDNFSLDDDRFNLELIKKDEDNKTIYYIYLNTKDKTPIRLSQTIIK